MSQRIYEMIISFEINKVNICNDLIKRVHKGFFFLFFFEKTPYAYITHCIGNRVGYPTPLLNHIQFEPINSNPSLTNYKNYLSPINL